MYIFYMFICIYVCNCVCSIGKKNKNMAGIRHISVTQEQLPYLALSFSPMPLSL